MRGDRLARSGGWVCGSKDVACGADFYSVTPPCFIFHYSAGSRRCMPTDRSIEKLRCLKLWLKRLKRLLNIMQCSIFAIFCQSVCLLPQFCHSQVSYIGYKTF